jgi:hypothetical protein
MLAARWRGFEFAVNRQMMSEMMKLRNFVNCRGVLRNFKSKTSRLTANVAFSTFGTLTCPPWGAQSAVPKTKINKWPVGIFTQKPFYWN